MDLRLAALLLPLLAEWCWCLRMVVLDVPSLTRYGDSVKLSCEYELFNERLYSIKWYKDDVEFYRFVPNDWPPGQFLPLPGVNVDLSQSGRSSVVLRRVDLNSTGTYRCEVSAESPSFQTVEAERRMDVMVLPDEDPLITGGEPEYSEGDTVAVNCTSAKSKPAPTLRWFINNLLAGPDYETEYETLQHSDGLETATLSLRFVVRKEHFTPPDHVMRLRCAASVARAYARSEEALFPRRHSAALQVEEDREKPVVVSASPTRKEKESKDARSANGVAALPHSHWLISTLLATMVVRYVVT